MFSQKAGKMLVIKFDHNMFYELQSIANTERLEFFVFWCLKQEGYGTVPLSIAS